MSDKKQIARELYQIDAIKFGDFTLKSGIWSPYYIQLRILINYPSLLFKIGEVLGFLITEEWNDVDKLVGVAYAGIPIVTATALATSIPCCYTRKEIKEHGIPVLIEGELKEGENVVIVDDLITSGQSNLETIDKIKSTGVKFNIKGVAVLLDREQGGKDRLASLGIKLVSAMKISEVAEWLKEDGLLSEEKYNTITEYIKNPPEAVVGEHG